jgi:hypothetical protein
LGLATNTFFKSFGSLCAIPSETLAAFMSFILH